MVAPTDTQRDLTQSPNAATSPLGPLQTALMSEAHLKLFKQVAAVNRAWSDCIRRAHDTESDFTRRLIDCKDAGKASELCTEWLMTRAAAFLAESQRFTDMWLSFYSETAAAALGSPASTTSSAKPTPATKP
jgi:hypothetical protein